MLLWVYPITIQYMVLTDNFRRLGDTVTVVEDSPTDKEGLQRIMGARE